jgi:hypothetical protein
VLGLQACACIACTTYFCSLAANGPKGLLATVGGLTTSKGAYPLLEVDIQSQMLQDATLVSGSYWQAQGFEPWIARCVRCRSLQLLWGSWLLVLIVCLSTCTPAPLTPACLLLCILPRSPQAQKAVHRLLNPVNEQGQWREGHDSPPPPSPPSHYLQAGLLQGWTPGPPHHSGSLSALTPHLTPAYGGGYERSNYAGGSGGGAWSPPPAPASPAVGSEGGRGRKRRSPSRGPPSHLFEDYRVVTPPTGECDLCQRMHVPYNGRLRWPPPAMSQAQGSRYEYKPGRKGFVAQTCWCGTSTCNTANDLKVT